MIKIYGRNISIIQGNSGSITFRVYDKDLKRYQLDGFTVTFAVKRSKKHPDQDAFITKTLVVPDGISTDSKKMNVINVFLRPEDTNIPVDIYYWAIQLRKGTYVNEAMSGQFYIVDGVINDYE